MQENRVWPIYQSSKNNFPIEVWRLKTFPRKANQSGGALAGSKRARFPSISNFRKSGRRFSSKFQSSIILANCIGALFYTTEYVNPYRSRKSSDKLLTFITSLLLHLAENQPLALFGNWEQNRCHLWIVRKGHSDWFVLYGLSHDVVLP